MLSPDLVRQIRLLQIRARRAVQSLLGGQYHSAFKGSGLSFEEVREYQPGDDVRSIDWNVTARMGQPFLKRYREERELTVLLAVDVSGSMRFGSGVSNKQTTVAELAALIACCAIANQDRVGLLTFSDQVSQPFRPARGLKAVLRLLRTIFTLQSEHKTTNLDAACQHLTRVHRKRAIVFLLSDFLGGPLPRSFQLAAQQHDFIAVKVQDAREQTWPSAGLIALQDGETGRTVLVDSSNSAFRTQFEERQHTRQRLLTRQLRGANADVIDVTTDGGHVDALLKFFRMRERRSRGLA